MPIRVFARFGADRHRQGRGHAHIEGMGGVDGAGELAGGEGAVIEIGRRGVGVDEQRAVARVPGIDIVDVLAVADIGIHGPARDIEFHADIVLVIVFLQHFHADGSRWDRGPVRPCRAYERRRRCAAPVMALIKFELNRLPALPDDDLARAGFRPAPGVPGAAASRWRCRRVRDPCSGAAVGVLEPVS